MARDVALRLTAISALLRTEISMHDREDHMSSPFKLAGCAEMF
jgi:hypothetical protein